MMKQRSVLKVLSLIGLSIILIPIILFGGYKGYEWYELNRLGSISIVLPDRDASPTTTAYDVIVIGGEPEGVAAAVAAARLGSKTLLIEKRDGLGGLMTYGMLNFLDYDQDMHGKIANAGIFAEWHKLVGNRVVFDIDTALDAFMYLVLNEENLELALETTVSEVQLSEDQALNAVTVLRKTPTGYIEETYTAQRFIDATQDADLAALAGVPYFIGGEDIGLPDRKMAVTPMIHLKNVNWNGVMRTALQKTFGHARVTPLAAWGFVDLHDVYQPTEENTRLRGLNIARQSDRSVVINALHIFEVDGLDQEQLEAAIAKGARETEHVLAFLRSSFPGFENAEIASMPTELYVRETRHILAEYQLPITDVWENRDHWDQIALGSYPVDVQASSINDLGFIISDPKQYAIPFRSLVPLEIDNLLVTNRSAGYSSLAAGSTRIMPTGMSTAEAAGVAAHLSIQENISVRELANNQGLVKALQEALVKQGARIYPFELAYPYQDEWYYPALQTMLTYGLASGGHENELYLEQPMQELEFIFLIMNSLRRAFPELAEAYRYVFSSLYMDAVPQTLLTPERAYAFLNSIPHLLTEDEQESIVDTWSWEAIFTEIDNSTLDHLQNKEQYEALDRLSGYLLIDQLIQHVQLHQ